MSKRYRCRVKKDLSIEVDARDQVEYRLRLNDILAPEETNDILRSKLADAGGRTNDEGKVILEVEGAEVEVDPKARTATARSGRSHEVRREFDGEVGAFSWGDNRSEAQDKAETRVEKQLQEEVEREREKLVEEARRTLGKAADEVSRILREATAETEKESALRKADKLGKVISVEEEQDAKTGDRTVVIEIELPE